MSKKARNFKRGMRRYANFDRYVISIEKTFERYDKSARSDAHMRTTLYPPYFRTPAPFHNGRKR